MEDDVELNARAEQLQSERFDRPTFGPSWQQQVDELKQQAKDKYGWDGVRYLQNKYLF